MIDTKPSISSANHDYNLRSGTYVEIVTVMTIFCRVVVMIVTVWLLSALISIPPLLGWRKGRNQHFSIQCQNIISGFLVLPHAQNLQL